MGDRLDGLPDLQLFDAHGGGLKAVGCFHGDEGEDLHHVVLEHVTESTSGLIEGTATFNADGLGAGDLDAFDVFVVPEGLKDAVAEAEDRDVLHGLFAEVVVDAKDLVFLENGVDVGVELNGRGEVGAERLFDDDVDPAAALVGGGHAVAAEEADDVGEELRRDGEIEQAVAAGTGLRVNVGEVLL